MSAARKTAHPLPGSATGTAAKRPDFRISRPDTILFSTLDGLTRQTGEPAHRLRRLMAKELADNALDACDAAGRSGQATIERIGADTYVVEDHGHGLSGGPDALAGLFTIHRPMVSGKFLRRPERGALGNGLRIVVGCVVASEGTIEVTTGGLKVMLRPRKIGPTEIVSTDPAETEEGTRLVVRVGPSLPADSEHDDLIWAKAALKLARFAAGPPYARQASPHWMDAEAFIELLMTIEPAESTLRQIVELFDGCTGRNASEIAAPFGKGRLARTLNDAEAVELLRAMQATARDVKPAALCPIGPEPYARGDGWEYARVAGTVRWGACEPQASIPYVVEAWVRATSRRGKSVAVREVFANRTPIAGDAIGAYRPYYLNKCLHLTGAGLDHRRFDDIPDGDCEIALHVTAPFVPILSIGKRPDLGRFASGIAEAIRKAQTRSRAGLPPDPPGPRNEPPPKLPRPVKAEPPPKQPPIIHTPTGILGRRIAAEAEVERIPVGDLLVMSRERDPYGLDTERGHLIGKWFANQIEQHVRPTAIHLRGVHYIIVTVGNIIRPDTGEVYVNDEECWRFLQEKAAKFSRWLGYLPFGRINDHRNEAPIWLADDGVGSTTSGSTRVIEVVAGSHLNDVPMLDDLLPRLVVAGEATLPRQPYRLAIIGEKSSLHPVVAPIAAEFGMDAVLDTGDASDTHLHQLAERASRDGRPCVLFYLSDFDPSGHNMPTVAARKFQALCDLCFPDLDVRLYPVALPSAPLKATEKRADAWRERWGREQTEIDALIALRPGALETILRDAITPFYDPTLAARSEDATRMPNDVRAWFCALPEYAAALDEIDQLRITAIEASETLADAIEEHATALRRAVEDAPNAPRLDAVDVRPEIPGDLPDPLFHTLDDFRAATRKLIARRDGGSR